MKKYWLIPFIAVFIISMLFMGISCKEEKPAEAEEEATEETVEETAEVEEAEEVTEPVEILFWAVSQENFRPFFDEVFSSFNDTHENIQIIPEFKDTQAFDQLLATAVAAGEGPDAFFCVYAGAQREMAKNGSLLALNDYYPEDQMGAALRTDICEVDGKIYALAAGINMDLIQFNKEIFKKAGLDTDGLPDTWDEFIDACQKIKDIGISPWGFTNKEGWYLMLLMTGLCPQSFDSNEEMTDALAGPDGTFTDPRFIAGLEYIKELYDKGYLLEGGLAESYNILPAQMISQEVAMTRGHERFYAAVKAELGDITGLDTLPVWSDGELAGKVVTLVPSAYYAMGYTEHPQETVDVIAYLTNYENSNLWYKNLGMPPATTNWDSSLETDPNVVTMQKKLKEEGGVKYIMDLLSADMLESMKKNLELYILGEITAQEVGERVDAERE